MNKLPEGFQEWTGSPATSNTLNGFQEWTGGDIAGPAKAEDTRRPASSDQDTSRKPASVDEFVQQISPIAQRIAQKIGAPVDAVIGQLGLETGWGKSVIPGTNNYGNIKDTSGKGVAATDNMTGSRDRYRQYATPEEFADDYAKLVGTNPRYKGAVGAKDAQGFFTGLKQGGYAEDPNYVQSGVAASRTAAESLKKAGFKQESSSLPDMTGIPKWSEISTSEKFSKLPDAEKARTKSAYFDELIAPYVAAEGLDVASEKAKFIGVSKKEEPGLISRAADAAAGVLKAMNPFSPTPGLMEGVSQTVRQENTDRFNLPLSADTRAKLDYQYERATPEQRAQLSKADGVVGMYFTERNKQYAERDKLTQFWSELISDSAFADIADPRFEARTRQLIRSGMTAEGAKTYARTEMQLGMTPGGIKPGSATESDFDFELQDRFKNAPAVIRGAVKGYQGYKQGSLGILHAAADAIGSDEAAAKFAKGSSEAQGAIDAVGDNKNKAGQMFEGAISSISQQMPMLIGGAVTGSEAIVLGSMAVQSFGQEYAQGRSQNLSGGDAAKRASLFAAFEVVGEKFGLGNTLKALRMSAAGAPTKDLAMELSKALIKEIPGEVLTTTGQFATDKVGSFGLNKEAGMAEYLSQVGDTIGQTVMQSALMMGGTGGVSTTARHLQNRSNNGAQLSEIYANDARDRALSKWESNPLVRPAQSPQATQSPQAAPQSPQAHPTSQVADAVVRDLAAAAGMDVESLIPAKTLPVQPAAVEPIAAVPEAQGDSGIADQSSTPESRELELWLKSSDVGLSPDEQAELSALQNTVPQEQTQNGIEQWPAASPDVATQANDVQGADLQRSDGDQRRDMGEGQRPDTNAQASLPSAGEDLALRDEGPSVQALNPSINPQQEILSEPTPVEAQQAAPQGFEPQQVQADAAPGIAPWPDPSQPVTQAQTRAPSRAIPDDLLGMLNASGGISSSIRSDIDQDAKGRPGLYRASGRNIDEIGALMAEYGYIAPDEANDSAVVLEMLRRAVGGERIMTAQGMENMRAKEDAGRYRSELVSQAKQLGINPVGKSTDRLAAVIEQEMVEREAIFEKRKQELIQESADAEQAIEDVLALFGSGSPSFQWLADKFAEISERENADHRKSGYDSLVRAARQALRKWHADNARVEAVIEKSLEDGYGSTENPFGPSEGVAGEAEPVTAAEGARSGSVQSSDGRGQGFALETQTEQTLAEKVAREQDQALADKQTADAQREGFTLSAQTAQEVRSENIADMFGEASGEDIQKGKEIERERQLARGQSAPADLFSSPESKPDQETESSGGKAYGEAAAETKAADQEKLAQDFRLYPDIVMGEIMQRGELPALMKGTGKRVTSGFNALRLDDRAKAYADYVANGGKPVDVPADYNEWVQRQYDDAEQRRKDDDKPLAQLAEERRIAEGRPSYMEAQAQALRELGIKENAEGEPEATEEQWAKVDARTDAILRGDVSQKAEKVSTSAEPVQNSAETEQIAATAKSKPNQETEPSSGNGSDQFGAVAEMVSQERSAQESTPARAETTSKQPKTERAEQLDNAAQRFPDIADVQGMDSGLGGIVEPRRIAEGKTLYREVGAGGLHDLLGLDGQAELANFFVADNPDLALGQGGNKGVQVEFRPNSLSGSEHKKPGTGDMAGREYRVDLRAPRAVQSVTIKASDLKLQRGIVRRVLASEFSRTDLPDGRIRFDRKGMDLGIKSDPARSYVRLQSFDHPSVGVLNNLREQKDAAWSAVKKLKAQISDGRNDLRVKLIQAESAHKDLVRQESSARESVEEAANTQGLTTYKPSSGGSSGPLFSRSETTAPPTTDVDGMRSQLRGRRLDPSLTKIFYSKQNQNQEQIAREIFGNPNPKSTVDQITKELSGEGSLGSNIKVIQSALDLPANERRQVFKSSSADIGLQAVFFPDSGRVYLIADNIEPGEALSALLHDGGVHAGLYGMLGERGINSLAAQIKDWSINSLGKEEGRIAKLALARIPESTSPNHKNEEAVAYFITEAVNAGHGDPKPMRSSAISRWFAKLWKMVESAIQKLGADPSKLTVDDVVALARGALERVKAGEIDPRRDENEKPLPKTITIDGKERPTTNSNGKQIHPTREGVENFWRWFGDSKVVDADGKPLVVYHGTDANITEFKVSERGTYGGGIYLTPDTKGASDYAIYRGQQSPTVYPLYASIKNPATGAEAARIASWRGEENARAELIARGYDGVIDMRSGEIVAFYPEQIKSAIGNSGAFDASNPSILASRSYSPEQDAFRKKAGIGNRPTIKQKLQRWADGMLGSLSWDAFRQGALDQFHGVKLAELATIGALPVEQSAYVTSRLATGASSVMAGLLGHGQARWAANGQHLEKIEGTKGLLDILKPVEGQLDDFLGWMVANRASRLMKEGRENNFTDADIQAGLSLANGKEDLFKQVAKDFADFKRSVLDIAEQAGLIDPAGRRVWDHADWIPFYRQMQNDAVKGPGGNRGLSKQSSGIRQLKGGDSAINDPLENILLNFQHLIDASLKNNALRKVIGNVAGKSNSDEFLESVGYGMQGAIVSRDQIKKQLIAAGTPQQMIDALPAEALFGMAKMWALKAPEGKDIIRVMENGKPHFYRVTDPLLLKAVTSFEPFNVPGLATMRAFKRLLTRSVTATPAFMVRNFVRDWFSSAIISRDSTNVISALRGAVKSFSQSGGYEQMMFAGASFAGGQTDGADPEATAKAMRRELRKKGFSAASADEFMASILDRPIRMWDAYSKIGEAIENANRDAMFEAAKRAGKSDTAAAFEALDLMDFRLRGSHAAYQMFADIIPFVNARVQGLYRLGRSNPKQVAIRGGLLLLIPSVLLALANAGNDEYEELPDWDKDTYWHFFIGGHHFRLPKPFEVGVMFGTIPERITRAMLGNDSPKKLAARVWFSIADQFSLVQWPQFAKPALEVAMNEDGFSKRPIETVADKSVIPSMRASYYTSDTMKALAGMAPGVSDATGMSPKRMQHLWNGYLGSVGAAALSVSDFAVRRFQGLPFQEAMRRDEYPLLGVFYREAPAKNSGYVEEIYKMAKESSEWKKTYETAMKSGRADYAKQILAENKEKISMAGGLDHAASQMSGASKKIEAIRKDPDLSSDEKREQIDAVLQRRNDIAEKVAKRAIKAWGGSI